MALRKPRLRLPAVVLLVVGELEEANAMPSAMAQQLAAHSRPLAARPLDLVHHSLASLSRAAHDDGKVGGVGAVVGLDSHLGARWQRAATILPSSAHEEGGDRDLEGVVDDRPVLALHGILLLNLAVL
eukprot:3488852-Prymnesium_polylepis.1